MTGHSTADVAKLTGLSPARIRALVRDGFVAPRKESGRFRFSFQDLVIFRVAKDLVDARVSARSIRRALKELRADLPKDLGLGALQIRAEGAKVVVHDGDKHWEPESGQLHFDLDDLARKLGKNAAPLARRRLSDPQGPGQPEGLGAEGLGAEGWYDIACDLEAPSPDDAVRAYERVLELEPGHVDAHVNLGRLLHEAQDLGGAERHYRAALDADPADATAAFNLGVVLEDQQRDREAVRAYRRAIDADPAHPDAHYNVAAVCERLGERVAALRHLKRYRELRLK